jgi:amino acid transporter
VLVKLISHSAPSGHRVTMSVFTVPPGTGTSALFLGVVFGFLSFAGFEGAATLGEETTSARRNIPRAFIVTVALAGIFFVALTAVAAMGFGTTAAGVRAFAGSSSVLGDLGRSYIGSGLGDVVNVGVAISAFGGGLAAAVAASRLLFAFGRVGLVPALERGVTRGGNPMVAFNVTMAAVALIYVVMMICGVAVRDIALWLATIGTFPLLFAYAFTTIGAGRYLFGWRRLRPRWEIVIPVLAVAFIGYVLYKNLVPAPASPYDVFPYVAAAWLVLGAVLVVARPRMARSIGADLSQLERADEQGQEELR